MLESKVNFSTRISPLVAVTVNLRDSTAFGVYVALATTGYPLTRVFALPTAITPSANVIDGDVRAVPFCC